MLILKRKRNIKIKRKRKEKKKEKEEEAFTWLQTCFLDVGVTGCNSLADSHFHTNVIDDVEILFNYDLHITFYVSHRLTSCTHHKQIFIKHCTCDCVSIYVAIQNCSSWNV